jgi:diadenosine tetraphosphate (Ap4A) HIT family hydrolase
VNETIRRFGYPATLVADYSHWVVLLRPAQPTLGSLILAAKSDSQAFGELEPQAFAELPSVIPDIESALRAAVDYAKINYLMLMMVDPHVHFHVIPRYDGSREAHGIRAEDRGWPKVPMLGEAIDLDDGQQAALVGWLKALWPRAAQANGR